jgi:hypothetical protein
MEERVTDLEIKNSKQKQSCPCHSPWRSIGLCDVEDPTLSKTQSVHDG